VDKYTLFYALFCYILGMLGWGGVGGGGGGVSCVQGHLIKCPLGDLNKCPLGDLNKSPWENYLEGERSEEIIKSRFRESARPSPNNSFSFSS
jgi:hypothetical protein